MKRWGKLSTVKIGPKLWRLDQNMSWLMNKQDFLTVPRGFITDGASCPTVLYNLCAPMAGPHAEAAVLHDYLYSKDCELGFTRKEADRMFYEGMISDGTNKCRAYTIWLGVRIGGWASFKKCYSKEKGI